MKRDEFTLSLDLGRELIVDNFAGGGGTSAGLEAAFGRPVDIAINHDPEALAMHALNHPYTSHLCESVWDVNPIAVTGNQPVGLVWLSPDCKHFSKAKGGTPVSRSIRGLAWVGMRWAALCKPRILMLENVEEFQTWGPVLIGADGQARPDPTRRGRTFQSFVRQLRAHGYSVDWRLLRACDYGAPTIRKRLFLIARRDGLPIIWPDQTHAEPTDRRVLAGALAPYRSAAECIDFSLPAQSVFGRPKPLASNTLKRVAKGLFRHVLDNPQPFIVTNTSEHSGAAIDQPLPTVTTGGQQMIGQPVLAPFLTEHAQSMNQRTMPVDSPLRTVCAGVKGGHFSVVSPHLITIGYGERAGQSPRVQDIHAPLGTVVAGGVKHALVAPILAHLTHHGDRRGSTPAEPLPTVTGAHRGEQSLISAFFEQANGGFYDGDGRAADTPMSTITGAGSNQRLVAAHLVQYYGQGGQYWSCTRPMPTVTTKDRMGLVSTVHVPADALAPEHWEKARLCAALLREHMPGSYPDPADLVLLHHEGAWWALVDITLRMLKPRELYRAQGFPETYVIDQIPNPALLFDSNGKQVADPLTVPRIPLTTTAQIRMCGNSVCPPVAEALVRANFAHEASFRFSEAA